MFNMCALGSIEIRKVTDGASGGYSLQVTNGAGTALSTEVRIYARSKYHHCFFIKPKIYSLQQNTHHENNQLFVPNLRTLVSSSI